MPHEVAGGAHDLPGPSVPRPWPLASWKRGSAGRVSAKCDVAGLRTICTAYGLPVRVESNGCSFQHTKQHRALQRERLTPSSVPQTEKTNINGLVSILFSALKYI